MDIRDMQIPQNFRLGGFGAVAYTAEVRTAFDVLHEKLNTHSKSEIMRRSLIWQANQQGAKLGNGDVRLAYQFLTHSFKDGMIFGRHSFIFRSAIVNLAASLLSS